VRAEVNISGKRTNIENIHDQESSWQEELPAELRTLFERTEWEAVTIGRSGMQVFHAGDGYLKIARQEQMSEGRLLREKERLLWLQGRLPVPQVYYYGQGGSFEYLYLSEIQGVMACDQRFREDMPSLIHLLAEALHLVHAIDSQQCPFTSPLQPRLEEIQQQIAGDHIDEAMFATDHQGLAPQAWYEQLERLRPATDELAFVHGDFCLPNILIDPRKKCINGLIDWELCGLADRHEDLVDACWSLGYNFDPSWIPLLQEAYGLESIDPKRLAFYQFFRDRPPFLDESNPFSFPFS
jgi:aminoglycoside phosphotransferase